MRGETSELEINPTGRRTRKPGEPGWQTDKCTDRQTGRWQLWLALWSDTVSVFLFMVGRSIIHILWIFQALDILLNDKHTNNQVWLNVWVSSFGRDMHAKTFYFSLQCYYCNITTRLLATRLNATDNACQWPLTWRYWWRVAAAGGGGLSLTPAHCVAAAAGGLSLTVLLLSVRLQIPVS